jgi:hypothetical protein
LRLRLRGGRASRVKINEVFKSRVQVSRALKSEGVTNSLRICVMFGVMLKFVGEGSLSSMCVFQLVDQTRRRSHKVSKVRVEGIVGVSNEYIGAEAGCWSAGGVISMDNGGCLRLERVEMVHPGSRLGMFICNDVCNLSVGVFGDS